VDNEIPAGALIRDDAARLILTIRSGTARGGVWVHGWRVVAQSQPRYRTQYRLAAVPALPSGSAWLVETGVVVVTHVAEILGVIDDATMVDIARHAARAADAVRMESWG